MLKMNCVHRLALLTFTMVAGLAFAQEPPALLVVPSKATMLVGDTHTFRAVGKDGRIQHNVQWSISPDGAASLIINGDEATVKAVEQSSTVVLTANAGGDSSEAIIEIRAGATLPTGTAIWAVDHLPGCKSVKMTQAVPSANGPDLYDEESCPQGTFIRAMTADGRELWRRRLGDPAGILPPRLKAAEQAEPGEHLNLSGSSLCDAVSSGMTKDAVSKLARSGNLRVSEKEQQSDSWELEGQGFRCDIFFDKAGAVMKKKKTIVTD
jgi:hypothetical protein